MIFNPSIAFSFDGSSVQFQLGRLCTLVRAIKRVGAVRGTSLGERRVHQKPPRVTKRSPLRSFKTSQEIVRLAAMHCIWFPLFLRNVEDLLHEGGIEISQETL